ncbi:PLP-dependent aminotransferase family protein [Paenibacillus sp. GCM10012307]|uniref:PLP-dependent aminotransferase family protein n=1 Tax=Paenibacillus roseus TaxID=2798579 RepID=A0A934MTV7_9BACL|nr:PLP-dependent aminotransferase family protein [Paenibacillus roseus]MBJ6360462.1 PLP-dependent aminotransferase family protein [Paenibacillus roseus]
MLEITPSLQEDGAEPLFMQLYRYLREELLKGNIPSGKRLPSIRTLAGHLQLSRTPVALAYEQLLAEGFIESRPRSGYFAAVLNTDGIEGDSGRAAAPALSPLPPRAYHAPHHEQLAYDFGYGSVDIEQFPLSKWKKWMNRCIRQEGGRLLLYGELQGEAELREEIAAYLHQTRGVRCLPSQIIVGAGTYHSLDLLFQLLAEDVNRIAAEEAVNDGVKALLGRFRYPCVPLRLEKDGVSIEDVRQSGAQAVYVTPSHQFPFGMTLSAGKRMELLQWAQQTGGYIIENDYDGEFRYGGRPIPSLQSMDEHGRVIYVGTFSKILIPSLRLSYMVLPFPLLQRFYSRGHTYDQLASPIFQHTLYHFMKSGELSRHIRKMRTLYQNKQQVLLGHIRRLMGDQAEIIGASSGLHILLHLSLKRDEMDMIRSAGQAGVRVYPTSVYALDPARAPSSTVMLGYGGLTAQQIGDGIERLAAAWLER